MNSDSAACFMVGHAHIDAAWLWRKDETERVCQATFASVLELMKRYPDFKFSQSSARYYQWMEERHPVQYALGRGSRPTDPLREKIFSG